MTKNGEKKHTPKKPNDFNEKRNYDKIIQDQTDRNKVIDTHPPPKKPKK